MNWLGDLYYSAVTQPLLNLLQIFQNITGDIGWAILLIAAFVNLILWPLFNKNYINSQKLKYLAPELERIQENFKDKPQEMMLKRGEVMKKHGISTGSFWAILLQLPFIISLYTIIVDINASKQLNGIYSFINPSGVATFGHKAFGTFELNLVTHNLGWIGYATALAVSVSSLMLGLYMFRIAPKPNLPEPPKAKPLFKSKDPNAPDFTQTLQKSIEIQSIYVFPVLYFVTNINFPVGLVIYFLGSSLSGLLRQVTITQYYTKNAEQLMASILDSDPSLRNPSKESVKIKAEPAILEDSPIAAEVLENDRTGKPQKPKTKKKPAKKRGRR